MFTHDFFIEQAIEFQKRLTTVDFWLLNPDAREAAYRELRYCYHCVGIEEPDDTPEKKDHRLDTIAKAMTAWDLYNAVAPDHPGERTAA